MGRTGPDRGALQRRWRAPGSDTVAYDNRSGEPGRALVARRVAAAVPKDDSRIEQAWPYLRIVGENP
jgi:hypothetical protein